MDARLRHALPASRGRRADRSRSAGLGRRRRRGSVVGASAGAFLNRFNKGPPVMRVVYWARFALAKASIIERLAGVAGCDLVVTETLAQTLAALPGAEAL